MLKATGLAALGAGLSACAGRRAGSLVSLEPPRRFARVHVSEDRIIRTVVGLRPFRPSGFVVRAEKVGITRSRLALRPSLPTAAAIGRSPVP